MSPIFPPFRPPRAIAVAAVPVAPARVDTALRRIRRLVWLFIFLWLIEGALRKWVAPGLSNPLLVVRDPVLLLIYFFAFGRKGLFPLNAFVLLLFALGAVAATISLVVTHTPPAVVVFGFRANFLHLPLIFLLPRVLDRGDVLRVGRWLLLVSGPMAIIVFGQFSASSGSWLNAGAGGGLEGQMASAQGHVRASGTFSFTNGLVGFTALVSAFAIYQVLTPRTYPKLLWLMAAGSLVVMVSLSGNRALVGVVALTVLAMVATVIVRPRFMAAAWKALVLGAVVVMALGSFRVFRQGLGVFAERFGNEESVKVGFFARYFEGVTISPFVWNRGRLEGLGLGLGTNAGAGMLTGGKRDMILAEGEWDRMMLEMGPPLGSLYLALRVGLTIYLLYTAWRGLRRGGDPLALLLAAGCYSDVLFGQLTQPTALGYVCIAGGLTLAATRPPGEAFRQRPQKLRPAVPPPEVPRSSPVGLARAPRGRSAYAEQMHGGTHGGIKGV